MLRSVMVIGTVMALALASVSARADHDRELRYVLGGALIGAAIGELAYASHYQSGYGYYYAAPHYHHVHAPRYFPRVRHHHPRHHHGRHFGQHRVRYYSPYRH